MRHASASIEPMANGPEQSQFSSSAPSRGADEPSEQCQGIHAVAGVRQVLERTLKYDPDELNALQEAERRIVREAAQRHGDEAFCFDPVLIEIVDAMIRLELGLGQARSSQVSRMTRSVASTLWEDEHCRKQLQRLWDQEIEALP